MQITFLDFFTEATWWASSSVWFNSLLVESLHIYHLLFNYLFVTLLKSLFFLSYICSNDVLGESFLMLSDGRASSIIWFKLLFLKIILCNSHRPSFIDSLDSYLLNLFRCSRMAVLPLFLFQITFCWILCANHFWLKPYFFTYVRWFKPLFRESFRSSRMGGLPQLFVLNQFLLNRNSYIQRTSC